MQDFYIMHKDIPTVHMHSENEKCTFEILDKKKAPIEFLNRTNLGGIWQSFLSERIPLLTDENAEKTKNYLYNVFQINIENIEKSNYEKASVFSYIKILTSLSFRCVSMTDCFWIAKDNELSNIKWENINPRNHELRDICKYKDLSNILSKQTEIAKNNYTNENVNVGATPKIWKYDINNVTLYKQCGIIETKAEILSSDILDHTNVPHVKYKEVSNRCCKCKNIANEEYSLINGQEAFSYFSRHDINIDDFCKTLNSDLYYSTQVVDFLIDNPDRTIYNQGFLRDNETGNIVDMLPLFDHNNAFSGRLKEIKNNNIEEYEILVAKAQYALSKCNLKFNDKINTFVFGDADKYLEFMNRAEEIGLFTKRQNKSLISNLFNKTPLYTLNEEYNLTYKDEQVLKSPDIEFNVETKTFVKSKTKQMEELAIKIENTIKKVIQDNHTVKKNFNKNNIIEYDIDHKKYEYRQNIPSMELFIKEIEKEHLKEKNITKENNNLETEEKDDIER